MGSLSDRDGDRDVFSDTQDWQVELKCTKKKLAAYLGRKRHGKESLKRGVLRRNSLRIGETEKGNG